MLATTVQRPLAQMESAPQAFPQAPQFARSSPRSTHCPEQLVAPLEHEAAHRPPEHTCPLGHALPQAPQLRPSLPRLTHALPHMVAPSEHAQLPALQFAPAGQALPHAPQWATLPARAVSQPLAALPSQLP